MLAPRMLLRRAVFLARLRQVKVPASNSQNPRLFNQNSLLRVLSDGVPRPQLPFLYSKTAGRPGASYGPSQNQVTRYISSGNTGYYRDIITRSTKLTAVLLAGMALYVVAKFLLWKETMERKFPAPPEWDWKVRWQFSRAASERVPGDEGQIIDWAIIGSLYENVLKILEDPNQEGKGLRPLLDDDGDTWVDGIGKAGLDLTEKSEPWRRGYYDCLMGAAKAAEQLDGWVYDTTTQMACPAEYVIGPSNPNRKPWPHTKSKPPLEENCKIVLPGPEALYVKIITSQGFTSRQRVEAAIAYADWLEFKGLSSTAEDVYDWALDIAMGALPMGANDIVDVKTGVINSKATYVSSNILTASTALANHHARNNNLAAALPIFLSILRARRHLLLPAPPPKPSKVQEAFPYSVYTIVKEFLTVPPYPPPPPTGDEIPSRTPEAFCEESAVMSNIGEILFSSSSANQTSSSGFTSPMSGLPNPTAAPTQSQIEQFQSGLSWTRDAVDLAEETLATTGFSDDDEEARTKCMECLQSGMENWSTMVERMLQEERAARESSTSQQESKSSYAFWSVPHAGIDNQNRWEGEAKVVDTRSRRINKMLALEQDRQRPLWMKILGKQRDF